MNQQIKKPRELKRIDWTKTSKAKSRTLQLKTGREIKRLMQSWQ